MQQGAGWEEGGAHWGGRNGAPPLARGAVGVAFRRALAPAGGAVAAGIIAGRLAAVWLLCRNRQCWSLNASSHSWLPLLKAALPPARTAGWLGEGLWSHCRRCYARKMRGDPLCVKMMCEDVCGACPGRGIAVPTSQPQTIAVAFLRQQHAAMFRACRRAGGVEGQILFAMHMKQRQAGRAARFGTHEAVAQAGATRRGAGGGAANNSCAGEQLGMVVPRCCTRAAAGVAASWVAANMLTTRAACRLAGWTASLLKPPQAGCQAAAAAGERRRTGASWVQQGCYPLCSAYSGSSPR